MLSVWEGKFNLLLGEIFLLHASGSVRISKQPSLDQNFFWLIHIQNNLHVLDLHSIFFLVELELAVFSDDEAEMLSRVAQIINTEAASTAFRAVVVYHSYIVYIKI